MENKTLLEKLLGLTCTYEELDSDIEYEAEESADTFKKYYDIELIKKAHNLFVDGTWDDNMFGKWCCAYLSLLTVNENNEGYTPIEELAKEQIIWDLDGLSFFDKTILEEEPEFLADSIVALQTLDTIYKTSTSWKVYSHVGIYMDECDDQYMLLVNEETKEYAIVFTIFYEDREVEESYEYLTVEEFKEKVNQLKESNYSVLHYAENYYEAE